MAVLLVAALVTIPPSATTETLTLDRALQIAFAESPTIRDVTYSLEISERNLKAQQASLKSQFNLTLTPYSQSQDRIFNSLTADYNTEKVTSSTVRFAIVQPIKWTDGTLQLFETLNWRKSSSSFISSREQENYQSRLTLQFTQPLFTYNRTALSLSELELSLENAHLNYAIQKLNVESQVTTQFFGLYYKQRSVQIAEEEFANSQESYEIIESKVSAGISAPEELYQADLTTANAKATLVNSRMDYQNSLDNFKILLGLALEREIEAAADVKKQLTEVNLAEAINHGLEHRMELRQRGISIQNALYGLIRTGAMNEFKASVGLSYGLTGTNEEFSGLFDNAERSQSVELTINVPLFDWGEKKHRLAASQARVESERLSADEERKQVMFEIRQSFRGLQNQRIQIEIAEKNVKNARLTYEINLERYRNGDLSSKDIEFYQNQLSREQLGEIAALINYKLALLELKIRALWDFENNTPVVAKR